MRVLGDDALTDIPTKLFRPRQWMMSKTSSGSSSLVERVSAGPLICGHRIRRGLKFYSFRQRSMGVGDGGGGMLEAVRR